MDSYQKISKEVLSHLLIKPRIEVFIVVVISIEERIPRAAAFGGGGRACAVVG